MIPILFEKTETAFTTNGIGRLSDAVSCVITEERNGIFELSMEYPMSGLHFDEIEEERIIYAQPRPGASNQAFRIYEVSKPINGIVTVNARHISYILNKTVVMPYTAGSCAAAFEGINSHIIGTSPFTYWTDKSVTASFSLITPTTVRAMLGGTEGSILDTFGTGEYEWDMYTVKFYLHRGQDNGVTIRYGKNLTDLENETTMENVYTAIVPYYASEGTVVTLPEGVIYGEHISDYSELMTIPVDMTERFAETVPTEAQLRAAGESYIERSDNWKLGQNINISFVDLADTEEYKNVATLQRVNLCDTVTVIHQELGVTAKAKVIKAVYNVLKGRYDSLELGDARTDLSQAVLESAGITGTIPTKSFVESAISKATAKISGGLGGYVVLKPNANGEPEEILIMDTPDISTAVNVIRMNQAGIAFSQSGYDPAAFTTAWTIDSEFVADFITAGTLNANVIRAGLLTSALNPDTYWNLDTGQLHLSASDAQAVAEYVDASGISIAMPYSMNGNVCTFRAQLLRGETDDTLNHDPTCYTWYKKENFETTYMGSGYTFTFDLADFVYGGSIILRFEDMEELQLLTSDNDILTDSAGDELLAYAAPTTQPYISCETDFTNGRAVSALELTTDQLLSRLNYYNGTGQTMESAISQTAHSISLTVSGDAGTQTGAGIEISLLDADGNVLDSSDGNITVSGNVVFKSNLTDGVTAISGDNLQTGIIHDINDNVVFNLVDGTLDISDGSINLGSGQFTVNSSGIATMNQGYLGTVTVNGSISGGAIYQTVSGAGSGSIGGNSPNGRQASITNGIVSAGQFTINGSNPVSFVSEGMDDRGHYGIYCTGHFSTNGAIWTNGDIGSADIICRGNSYAQNFIQSSDRRIKENIADLDAEKSAEFVYGLKPVSFNLKGEKEKSHGFIAQDVQEIAEDWDLVRESPVKQIEGENTLSIVYTEMIADLVATVQTLNKRVSELERIINGN